jgi:hypothetical protein
VARPRAKPAEQAAPGTGARLLLRTRLSWPYEAERVVLGAMGLWSASGDTGDSDSWRVLMGGLAERFGSSDDVEAWVKAHRDELRALAKCWRVEAAKADLAALWEAIDNDARAHVFSEQYNRWSRACVVAAERSLAAWDVPPAAA